MSAINYERAVELTAQMAKKYQETEESLKSLLSEKRAADEEARNEARMQEELAAKKAADKRRRQEEEAEARRRQETKEAEARRRREAEEAETRRRKKEALHQRLANVFAYATSLSLCLVGIYVVWWNLLSVNPAAELYWFRISFSAFVILLSWLLLNSRKLSRFWWGLPVIPVLMLCVLFLLNRESGVIAALAAGISCPILVFWLEYTYPRNFSAPVVSLVPCGIYLAVYLAVCFLDGGKLSTFVLASPEQTLALWIGLLLLGTAKGLALTMWIVYWFVSMIEESSSKEK
ncbi:MAG: cell envelope integrity protein TolA [Akkermansia sp.]